MSRTLAFGAAAGVLLAGAASAQIKSDGLPASLTSALSPANVPVEFVQPPDVEALKLEVKAAKQEASQSAASWWSQDLAVYRLPTSGFLFCFEFQ